MLKTSWNAVRWMTAACLFVIITLSHAAVPAAINYQAFLTNPTTGAPLSTALNQTLPLTFKLWDDATRTLTSNPPANLVYSETQSVIVTNGVFNVQIGTGTVPSGGTAFTAVSFNVPYWLEITIGTGGAAQTLAPRQPLASAPYALRAANLTSDSITFNTASGSGALATNTTGNGNTASGYVALFSNTTGSDNTASGYSALFSNTTGSGNTASGGAALVSNTTGKYNTASGLGALESNTTGNDNTASGVMALGANGTGIDNTASGYQALFSNTTANKNTAVGSGALQLQSYDGGANPAVPWDSFNTAVGYQALYANQPTDTTTGTQNTALGANALLKNTIGSNNIALGYNAGNALTTGSNNIDIGSAGVAGEGNTIRVGDAANHTMAFIAGIRGATTGVADAQPVVIDSAGQLGSALTLKVPGNNQWDLNSSEGDFTIGNATIRLKIGVPTSGSGAGDIAIKADGGVSHFSLFAAGGTTIYSAAARTTGSTGSPGVNLAAGGGSWSSLSDRAAKKDLESIDANAILAKVSVMPFYAWRYKSEVSGARHVGPMAQDFHAAFGLGDSDKTITTVDAEGVALVAIQGLNAKLESALQEKDVQLRAQNEKISALEKDRALQTARIEALELQAERIAELEQQSARLARLLSRLDKDDLLAASRP